MKTGDFINALVEDQGVRQPLLGPKFGAQMVAGLAVSLMIFFLFLGIRADFLSAIKDPHVVFKFVFSASLGGSLLPLVVYATRPEIHLVPLLRWLVLPMLVLGSGVAFQLVTSPSDYWLSGMVGRYPAACVLNIPVLSIGPLTVLFLMLRSGAPTDPVLSGAVAGAVSGGLAAFIYALHCPDDSALFVALWYSLAIGIVTVVGGTVGAKWLRW